MVTDLVSDLVSDFYGIERPKFFGTWQPIEIGHKIGHQIGTPAEAKSDTNSDTNSDTKSDTKSDTNSDTKIGHMEGGRGEGEGGMTTTEASTVRFVRVILRRWVHAKIFCIVR